MSVRIEVQTEDRSESWRYIATATWAGKRLLQIRRYGGPEITGELLRKMAKRLEALGYPVPDHYWARDLSSGKEQWRRKRLPR